jgi:hypothetical protein
MDQHSRNRLNILNAYVSFSPSSVDIIARIEHMDQVPDLEVHCEQLYEDGLLYRNVTEDGIVEYGLSQQGTSLIGDSVVGNVPSTKYTIFHQLRTKEARMYKLKVQVHQILQQSFPYFLTVIQIQHRMTEETDTVMAHSVIYGLLSTETIMSCGPLFGIINKST